MAKHVSRLGVKGLTRAEVMIAFRAGGTNVTDKVPVSVDANLREAVSVQSEQHHAEGQRSHGHTSTVV